MAKRKLTTIRTTNISAHSTLQHVCKIVPLTEHYICSLVSDMIHTLYMYMYTTPIPSFLTCPYSKSPWELGIPRRHSALRSFYILFGTAHHSHHQSTLRCLSRQSWVASLASPQVMTRRDSNVPGEFSVPTESCSVRYIWQDQVHRQWMGHLWEDLKSLHFHLHQAGAFPTKI